MNRTEFRTIIGLLIAMMALMNFQFIHLSGRITDNADAIAEIRVEIAGLRSDMEGLRSDTEGAIAGLRSEMVGEIAGLRAEMAAGFAKLENLVIREVYANRERILQLEQRMTDVEEIIIDAPADGD